MLSLTDQSTVLFMLEPQQRLNYEYVNLDDRRPLDPYHTHIQPSYHCQHHPPQNKEEVVMQAILEHNAAEARAKQRDMERYRYEKKILNGK